jgi:hypothetical protein
MSEPEVAIPYQDEYYNFLQAKQAEDSPRFPPITKRGVDNKSHKASKLSTDLNEARRVLVVPAVSDSAKEFQPSFTVKRSKYYRKQ